ncbi:retropepsin-like aspartic protease family protein [Caenimonas aquaedulcis]|uniref:Retroviral-like aspartic protease family protein n=1 Tax=Caenimonas aquaedulcis TaxID=2793270 RepID=A0A931H7C3_9BURK|nr:retropepsin-like aspartic protease [Caenimonas aquaedulcis]MBG9390021.1 retroviral-like aspartic protease family protein [Caenimonas aquaedulcis]
MRALLALAALLACTGAAAQSVALQGMLGTRALLIVDGAPPKSVAPGESYKGVKVLSTLGDQALVEIGGKRHTLRVGEAPASVGSSAPAGGGGSKIVLTAGSGGHFMSQGSINGRSVQFMVDTGATMVAFSVQDAKRLGIDYESAPRGTMSTANGNVTAWKVLANSVRVGDVEVHNVDAVVLPMSMPYVLLGNSFLTRFQMKRENDMMVLERRY